MTQFNHVNNAASGGSSGHVGLAAKDAASDFYFVEREEPERIADTLLDMVKNRMPGKFRLDPIRDVQVLCPMNLGSLGIRELNVKLQVELNPAKPDEPVVEKFGWQFRVRDKACGQIIHPSHFAAAIPPWC